MIVYGLGAIKGIGEALVSEIVIQRERGGLFKDIFDFCLIFMIIGAATAIRKRISDFWTCFAVCFLPILIVYYPVFQFGVDQTKSGEFPPYGVWLGNFVFLIVGILSVRRMMKN